MLISLMLHFFWINFVEVFEKNCDAIIPTPPREKAFSQKRGNVANVRSSRLGAKKLQFLSR